MNYYVFYYISYLSIGYLLLYERYLYFIQETRRNNKYFEHNVFIQLLITANTEEQPSKSQPRSHYGKCLLSSRSSHAGRRTREREGPLMEDEREKTENLSEASIYKTPMMNQCATGSIDGLTIMATGSQLARVARRRALV